MSSTAAALHDPGVDLRLRPRPPSSPLRGLGGPLPAAPADGEAPAPELTREDFVRLGESRAAARRDRRTAAAGLVALLAVVAAVTVVVVRDGDRGVRLASGGPKPVTTGATPSTPTTTAWAAAGPEAAPSTTAPGAAAAGGAAAAPTTTAAAPAAAVGTTTTAVAPATTAPAATTPATTLTTAPCRNSYDRSCGPFRFDPQPGPDQPMTVEVSTIPAEPRAGQPVVFRVVMSDPDGVDYNYWLLEFGDGQQLGASATATCDKFGPWDPPAPDPARAVTQRDFAHAYAAPGTYTFRYTLSAGPFTCNDAVTGVGDRPYASSAGGEVTVVVAP